MIYFEGKPSERSDVDARYGGSSFRLDEVPCVPAQLDFYIVEHARHRGDAYGDPPEFFRFVREEGQKGCLPVPRAPESNVVSSGLRRGC